VSAVPSSPCIVANGPLKGRDIISVIDEYGPDILGDAVYEEFGGKLPLLVKFIDAKKDLSIQVHPDDRLAMERHQCFGKTEMWYIISAEPGASILAGFKEELSPEDYKRRVADGTIVDTLARHEVHPGDVFFIPAGRVHAICGGVYLAEVQQSSDITYRLYDYNRPGLDGKPRQLHTELAAEALDYHVEQDYRTNYDESADRAIQIIDSPYFDVRIMHITAPFHRNLLKYDSFIISTCTEGRCKIRIRSTGHCIDLHCGHSVLIPAAIADYDVEPIGDSVRLLDAFVDNMDRSLAGQVTRFLHISQN
jgi:mannose-6-phosphate isomerase